MNYTNEGRYNSSNHGSSSSLSTDEFTTGSEVERINRFENREEESTNEDASTDQNDIEMRRTILLKAYDTEVKKKISKSLLVALKDTLRRDIIPQVKFVGNSKSLGSFEKPDFTSPDCWQNTFFRKIPSIRKSNDIAKVQLWLTYKSHLKMEFGNIRGVVTKKIKGVFMDSKYKMI